MTKKTLYLKLISAVVCIVLIAAMGLMLTSCGDKDDKTTSSNQSITSSESLIDKYGSAAQVIGQGKTEIALYVSDLNGDGSLFIIKTDKKYLGDALTEYHLIEGEESTYGLFVKKVNGITAEDKTFWAIYENGEMAMTGIDKIKVKAGTDYSLRLEKIN